jgi:Uma2 family endonuclease
MSVSKRELEATIHYPETDGKPMGETDFHIKLIIDLSEALRNFFRRQPDVYVSRDLLLYYEPGNTRKFVVPDVFVVRGVSKSDRRVYKLWEEGRPPNVVIEISSRETKKADLNSKFNLYERLGVAEYYVFDPEYRYIKPPLRAWRLSGGRYVEIAVANGRAQSDELGLELVNTGQALRLLNPATGQFLLTPEEEAVARQEADAARQEAEARAEHLAAKLRELGVDPDKL